MTKKIKDYTYNIYELTKRNMLIFFKNKTTIFFSLIAPVLILLIYILFLSDFQVNMIMDSFENINLNKSEIKSIVNSWVISGIIGISILTVALNTMFITISDRETKVFNDFQASPVNIINLTLSYFISAVIITFIISLMFAIVGTTYLLSTGGSMFLFSFVEILKLLGIILISSLSAVIILMFITSFFKKTSTAASFTGIFTALIGFLVGAYLPSSILPKRVQNVANLVPGTHSTSLFRQLYLDKVFNNSNIIDKVSSEFIDSIKTQYSYNLIVFNYEFNTITMLLYLLLSIIVFFVIYLLISNYRKKNKI
ncbi:MAG TPA: ABC transporter permease [Acholeplasma sp.]|nr:ABC transporter permease [Acholeplasma sp.]